MIATLIKHLPFDFLKVEALPKIFEYVNQKQSVLNRKLGLKMLFAIAHAKGEEAFTGEPRILSYILATFSD